MTIWKKTADVATTENLNFDSGFSAFVGAIDGVILKVGHRVLVKDQLTPNQNGYYIVSEIQGALTLTPTGETVEAEDVIRVNQGEKNAHTIWELIDTSNRIFDRLDIEHYSLNVIDELKNLWQVLPGSTATVTGYYAPGDKGGGDFIFLGVPGYAKVKSAKPFSIVISDVNNLEGIVIITAPSHGLGDPNTIASVYILGVTGLTDKDYFVQVIDFNTLSINANIPILGVNNAQDAKVQYIKLETDNPHKHTTGQRISVSGVVASGGAVDIRGIYRFGVINSTSLSIPIATTGGNYTPGFHAVIGDGGYTVPATDLTGTFGGLWQRQRTDYCDVRWFGAKTNWDGMTSLDDGSVNLAAFETAIGAMGADRRQTGKLIVDGHFYLSDTLVITQTILLEGSGQNESVRSNISRCFPGTWLVFPKDVTGIRIRGGALLDNPTKTLGSPSPLSGQNTILRNLTVFCKDTVPKNSIKFEINEEPCIQEGRLFHGIHASTTVRLENITVQNFTYDGIHIVDGECSKIVIDKNGNQISASDFESPTVSYIENSIVSGCGRDGFHISGSNNLATTFVINCCSAIENRRYGFFDKASISTYIGCHAIGNGSKSLDIPIGGGIGSEYHTEGNSNTSTFIGCYAASNENKSDFKGQINIIGGLIGGVTDESSAFILENGVASRAPFVYQNFRNDKDSVVTRIEVGQNTQDGGVLNFVIPGKDYNLIRYDKSIGWWGMYNSTPNGRVSIGFPTTIANPRRPAPLFTQGIFYGTPKPLVDMGASKALTNHSARTEIPEDGTWEKGDVIWNSNAEYGEPIGWVCISAGTQGKLAGATAEGAPLEVKGVVDRGDPTKLIVNILPDTLQQWSYITLAGSDTVFQILNDPSHSSPPNTVMLDAAAAPGAEGIIVFKPATFSTFGVVDSSSRSFNSNRLLVQADQYVTVTESGTKLTLPKSPVDGQNHSIKSKANVTTMVETEDNVLLIDGVMTVTVGPLENQTFRYNLATNEWEIR